MRDRKRKRRDYKVEEPPPGPVVLANLSERAKMTFPQKIYGVPYEFLPPWYHPSVLSSVEEMVFDGVFDEEGGIFTRERYIFLRDEIIYRLYENRKYGLSLMECYKDLGDPGEFIRVCLFLRHWNIIFPESETYFPRIGRRKNGCLGLLSLPEELIHFQPQPPLSEELTPFELDLCTICGQNSDALQFHCLKNAREILCGSCYCQGHYDTWFSSSDFEPFLPLPDTWSTPEIETLHQSVEDHGEDWAEVSKRVATRSMDECVLKFLRLPEEVYDYRFDPQASIAGGLVEAARALAAGLCESVAIAGAKAALDIFKEHVDISIRGVISSGDVFAELNWIERAVENEICHCLPEKRNALFSFKSDAHFAFLRASTEKAKEEAIIRAHEIEKTVVHLQSLEYEKVKKKVECINKDIFRNGELSNGEEPHLEELLDKALNMALKHPQFSPKRRQKAKISGGVFEHLMEQFERSNYLEGEETTTAISMKTGLRVDQIRTWFARERKKRRRE